MKMAPSKTQPVHRVGHSSRRGVALIMVLGLITILAILVMGFMSAVRIEHATARNFNNQAKARSLTEGAFSDAMARVALATPPLSTTKTWVSAPGVVYQIGNDGVWKARRLFSMNHGSPFRTPTVDWALSRMNLNEGAWITGENNSYGASTNSYPPASTVTNCNTPAKWPGWAVTNWSVWGGWENIDTNGWVTGVKLASGYTNFTTLGFSGGTLLNGTETNGCFSYTGTLGTDFDVAGGGVKIDGLGAYDHLRDGIKGSITVGVWRRDTGTLLFSDTITSANTATDPTGFFRMKTLATPVNLPTGQFSVAVWGITDSTNDRFAGPWCGSKKTTVNGAMAGVISSTGSGRYTGSSGVWPTGIDANGYHAANISFQAGTIIVTNIYPDVWSTNSLAGRFTYWIDDEAAKVNLNAAKYRDPSAVNSSVITDIDLRGLEPPLGSGADSVATTSTLDDFHAAAVSQPFNTLEEARLGFDPAMDYGSFQRNQFYTTVYSKEPNTDAFGQQRVNVTTISSPTSGDAYNRFNDSLWCTMLYSNALQGATNRNTFLRKYGDFGVQQILANIISYQDAYATPIVKSALDADNIPTQYCGLKKAPMLESIIVHVATNEVPDPDQITKPEQTNLEVRVYVTAKLVNPYDVDRSGFYLKVMPESITVDWVTNTVDAGSSTFNSFTELSTNLLQTIASNSFAAVVPSSPVADGFYFKSTVFTAPTNSAPVATNITVKLKTIRLLKADNANAILDWVAPTDFSTNFPNGMRFNAQAGDGLGWIVETNAFPDAFTNNLSAGFKPIAMGKHDPRVRTFPGWTAYSSHFAGVDISSNVVGATTNTIWLTAYGPNFEANWRIYPGTNSASLINPLGDDDVSTQYSSRLAPTLWGLLADTRPAFPGTNVLFTSHRYIAGTIKEAAIQSVGELSDIHTGYPWRTIRFRSVVPETTTDPSQYHVADPQLPAPYTGVGDPNTGLENVEKYAIADWVMLDMFQVGNLGVTDVVTGRMNINQRFDVVGQDNMPNPSRTLNTRSTPLKALLANITPDLYSTNSVVISGTPGTNFTKYLFSAASNNYCSGNWLTQVANGKYLGNQFDVLEPITVTHLGVVDAVWYDTGNACMGGIGHPTQGFSQWYCSVSPGWSNGFVRVCDSSGNEVVPREWFFQKYNAFIDPTSNFWMRAITPVTLNPGTYYIQSRNISTINVIPTAPGAVAGVVNVNTTMKVSPTAQSTPANPDASGVLSVYSGAPQMNATLIYSYTNSGSTEVTTQGATSYGVDLLAGNIARRSLQAQSPYAANPLFATPGEVCEVTGMGFSSSTNAVGVLPNKAERQRIIRRIANLVTTRSHAFSYWGMGELINDRDKDGVFDWVYFTPMTFKPDDASDALSFAMYPGATNWKVYTDGVMGNGDGDSETGWGASTDMIMGRAKYHAIIERYEVGSGVNKTTKVRSLYNRYYHDVLE